MADKPPLGLVLHHYGLEDVPDWGFNRSVRCPFHNDVRESASVNVEEELFKCFTCGVQGDVYAVVMQVEGVDFGEAKRRAEAIAGESGYEVRGEPPPGQFISRRSGRKRGNSRRSASRRGGRSRTWT